MPCLFTARQGSVGPVSGLQSHRPAAATVSAPTSLPGAAPAARPLPAEPGAACSCSPVAARGRVPGLLLCAPCLHRPIRW